MDNVLILSVLIMNGGSNFLVANSEIKNFLLFNIIWPVTGASLKPSLQAQLYEPRVFVQSAFPSHSFPPRHSSISQRDRRICVPWLKKISKIWFDFLTYLRLPNLLRSLEENFLLIIYKGRNRYFQLWEFYWNKLVKRSLIQFSVFKIYEQFFLELC